MPNDTSSESPWPNKPVMIIDDDAHWVELMQRALRSMGWRQVRGLSDPRQAIGLAREFKPAVILLDLRMRERDGMDLLSELSSELPAIPVIMVTAVEQVDQAVACMQHGAHDYLTKPVRKERLRQALVDALEERNKGGGTGDPDEVFAQLRELPQLREAPDLLIREALRRSNGVLRRAAEMLGVTPQAICNRRRRSQAASSE
ncbi:MAG: response regulator [Planctomycetota bacterium]